MSIRDFLNDDLLKKNVAVTGTFMIADVITAVAVHKSIEDIVMEDRFHDDMIKEIKRNKSIEERDKEIIIKFFGLNDDNEKSIQSLSKEYKISRNIICQIIDKGIRRLRHSKVPVMLIDYLH